MIFLSPEYKVPPLPYAAGPAAGFQELGAPECPFSCSVRPSRTRRLRARRPLVLSSAETLYFRDYVFASESHGCHASAPRVSLRYKVRPGRRAAAGGPFVEKIVRAGNTVDVALFVPAASPRRPRRARGHAAPAEFILS